MDLLLPLISLLLIAGGGGRQHVSFADAAMATNSETPRAYWEAVLPGTPMPPAISDLLAQQDVRVSMDDVTISPTNLKFVKGLRKIGPYYEKIKYKVDQGDKQDHIASQVENVLKEVSVSYGSQGEEDRKKGIMVQKQKFHKDVKRPSVSSQGYRPSKEGKLKEVSVSYGSEGGDTFKEVSVSYGSKGGDTLKEVHVSYGSKGGENLKEVSMSYGSKGGENMKEVSVSYGIDGKYVPKKDFVAQEGNLKEVSVSYGSDEGKDETIEFLNQGEENPHRVTMSYESEQEDDPNKTTMIYGSKQEDDPNKATMIYGSKQEDDPNKATMSYGSNHEENPKKVTMEYVSKHEDDPNKATISYGSEDEVDPNKATMSYKSEHEEDPNKATMSYRSGHENDFKTVTTGHMTHMEGEASHRHIHSHGYKNKREADVFFFRDMLRPGSMITPTIPPTTSLPMLLPRRVADSLPFFLERLSGIIAMFAPASLGMTRDIQWTLDTCEHPRTLPGEKAGCATSLESLSELATSLLGTSDARAFSAANLPVEAPGTAALRGRYNVTAARRLSLSSEIVTCHDLTYPYVVYYCHTSNPTAAYTVTLESREGGAASATMEALAVCHLDTSQWSPRNPFFELHNVKPEDVVVCHFLTKLSIVWVRAGEPGDAHAANR